MSEKILISFIVLLALSAGFLSGRMSAVPTAQEPLTCEQYTEISIIQLQKIVGDELAIDVSGPARILWGESMVENDGQYTIPLGQIKNENDLEFEKYPYVGNAKTMKFYPADSYPARGTAPEYRRFFDSKESAKSAGFIPMKNME